ncbi:cobalamin binding intrinsic factor-like isoform X1 [Conger conger]|uniref:cobalamin binding intrinsic factor-like isoform X1 n=1 Tax=Conger conger TaxID=82655 RepID=UPI002A5A738E|nr:cobalamin binding intrinsic factor-like isoform X1 [Conger conger]XP_061072206.1 cobalamin binding intrinsic factor-like isoform X1 [Conger conger]
MAATTLLSTVLVLLVTGTLCNRDPIMLTVANGFRHTNHTYSTSVAPGGVLLGAMKQLQKDNSSFNFTTKENLDYSPFLVSVNGLAGNEKDRTYWQLRVDYVNGSSTVAQVGVGCYIPKRNEHILLNFTTY